MKKGFLLYPSVVLFVFIPLLLTFFFGGYGQELADHELPIIFGLFAYSLLLVEIFLSTRPKLLESKTGLQNLYAIHGAVALMILLTAVVHIGMEAAKSIIGNIAFPTAPLGVLGFLCLAIATLMGILHLSVTFISKSPKLMRRKDGSHKRERALWLHRLSVFATVLLFGHIISIPAIRENLTFIVLLSVYVTVILFHYGWAKLRSHKVTHILNSVELAAPNVHKMNFIPIDNKRLDYRAGQYIFVRFMSSALPKESHPFSIVSAPSTGENSLVVMAKESGDYTEKLKLLRQGDKAVIEGPYGDFWSNSAAAKENPIVLLAGGIGITPHLSILDEQLAANPERSVHLIWGAAHIQDTFNLDMFKKMEQDNPNFRFYLILSREDHPPYSHGQINTEYLSEIGINALYSNADFFICGPSGMMTAMESILINNGVDTSRIHIEKFAF